MPKAARARVASPPAGAALVRAIRDCLPDRVRTMGENAACNHNGDNCQWERDDLFSTPLGDRKFLPSRSRLPASMRPQISPMLRPPFHGGRGGGNDVRHRTAREL